MGKNKEWLADPTHQAPIAALPPLLEGAGVAVVSRTVPVAWGAVWGAGSGRRAPLRGLRRRDTKSVVTQHIQHFTITDTKEKGR